MNFSEEPKIPPLAQTGSFAPGEIGEIPRTPGVYMMFDAKGKVVYVGKAINLRARVRQYFAESGGDSRLSVPLIRKATHHIETIVTENEKEAYLLENTLIKRHRPRYNVLLRDDKTYVSVRIDTKEKWPRAMVTRVRSHDKATYFGPFINPAAIRRTLGVLQRVFPLRSCTNSVLRGRSRPCMLHQIGRCCAPCMGKVTPEEYAVYVRNTVLFLQGRSKQLQESLREQMQRHSERMEYEQAAICRDRLAALELSEGGQHVVSHDSLDRDVVGYAEEQGQGAITLQFVRNGQLVESMNWVMPVYGHDLGETMAQFLGQYYGEGRLVPQEILLPHPPESLGTHEEMGEKSTTEIIEEWLSDLRGGRVHLRVPMRGEKKQLVALAETNAREALSRKLSQKVDTENILSDLERRLHLDGPPRIMECYDIATLQGSLSVGSKVAFLDGEPHKANYRLYRIKSVEGQDDFAMMREVLERRFRSAVEKNEEMPDLVVVDGGRGQLGAALDALASVGAGNVAVAALAKSRIKDGDAGWQGEGNPGDEAETSAVPVGKKRSPERLFIPGRKNPVLFPPYSPGFYLLQSLRDEAHRFVNTYHGKLRRKKDLRSSLEDIPGIGKGRARALLRHFGSLARIRQATMEELAQVPGVTAPLVQEIYTYFHSEH